MEKVAKILNKILPQVAVEHNFDNYDFQIEPISSGGGNFTTTLYNVTVNEKANTHHMFVKVAAIGKEMRLENPNLYSTEIFVYTKLAKIYEALENKYNVPQEHRMVFTKFYGCDPTENEETIVLENLVKKGYQTYDRFNSYDWAYASSAMTELAKLHALSFAYSEYYPEEYNKVLDDLKFFFEFPTEFRDLARPVLQRALEIVNDEAKDKLKRVLDSYPSEAYRKFLQDCYRTPVLAHRDFKPNNLLHKIRDDGTVDIKIVDFQAMQGASPVVDIINFVILGSDGKFREQYYEKLLDHYYAELEAAMRRFHLDPETVYSRADFDYELKQKLPHGLVLAVYVLPMIAVDAGDVNKVDELNAAAMLMLKTTDRYAELLKDAVNDYIKWGIL